nr:PREDICTED: uncharacterized protein LOC107982582 [Anolis carolinensis]|eukprot:XP_016847438.1 PREDICTED: uncharacterized protein LOC107982582 [Anolis carolinensis]
MQCLEVTRTTMVIKEKTKETDGPHVGLNMSFASEPDFICSDNTAQAIFQAGDDLTQYKKTNSYTAHLPMPDKEKHYVLKTKTKVRERAYTVQPKSELENLLPNEQQTKEEADKHLEYHQGIAFQSVDDVLDEKPQKNDATVTGQILFAVASLRDADKSSIQAAAAMLNSILKKEKNKLRGKVPEIIDIIYFHMRAIQEPSAREAAIGAVCLLTEKHTEEAITSLLRLSLLCDRHITQIWEGLGQAKQPVRLQVLAKLLEVLKRRPFLSNELPEPDPSSKDNFPLLPLACAISRGNAKYTMQIV